MKSTDDYQFYQFRYLVANNSIGPADIKYAKVLYKNKLLKSRAEIIQNFAGDAQAPRILQSHIGKRLIHVEKLLKQSL